MKELGEKLFRLQQEAKKYKSLINELKLIFGMTLQEIKDIYREGEENNIPEFDPDDFSFNQFLAEIHLNKRRIYQMLRNARYVKQLEIPPEDYHLLDSSVIDLCRKKDLEKDLDPRKFIHNSYSDIKKWTT